VSLIVEMNIFRLRFKIFLSFAILKLMHSQMDLLFDMTRSTENTDIDSREYFDYDSGSKNFSSKTMKYNYNVKNLDKFDFRSFSRDGQDKILFIMFNDKANGYYVGTSEASSIYRLFVIFHQIC
jgi:hypothetical protein